MPLYEYKCVKCGHRFEKIESLGASETKKCPKCGARSERMASAPAIQFKGSGWYVTDYAGKNTAAASEGAGDAGTAKSGDKSSEKSGESKKETKTESKSADTSNKGAANRKKK